MIIITGAAGFIGSCLTKKLNDEGHSYLLLVDDFSQKEKEANWEGKRFFKKTDRKKFIPWFNENAEGVRFVFHLGARTDTTEKDTAIFDKLNLEYSKSIWEICGAHQIPLVYASSAATYGLGENGYDDRHDIVGKLKPLNPYGVSKNEFDKWVFSPQSTVSSERSPLDSPQSPPFWAGLKFFNVYGPNEYHKGRMASVIFHTVKQIEATGGMKLFRSHKPGIADGHQSRDFIYVKDVVDVIYFFFKKWKERDEQTPPENGLYNLGTGKARTFLDLAENTFKALGLKPNISFIDTPEDIRETYQYFTEANMDKLRKAGYEKDFYTLEKGVKDYVGKYLKEGKIW